jgi:hypothetical protein
MAHRKAIDIPSFLSITCKKLFELDEGSFQPTPDPQHPRGSCAAIKELLRNRVS